DGHRAERVSLTADDPVVIEADRSPLHLLEIETDELRSPEIEGRSLNLFDLPIRHQVRRRRVLFSKERELMIADGPGLMATQVPVPVVRHVDERGPITGRAHLDPQLVVVGQSVDGRGLDSTRVALLTVRRRI